jgi:hypothetical protein
MNRLYDLQRQLDQTAGQENNSEKISAKRGEDLWKYQTVISFFKIPVANISPAIRSKQGRHLTVCSVIVP